MKGRLGLLACMWGVLLVPVARAAEIRVEGGILCLDGVLRCDRLNVATGAVLCGAGVIEADTTVAGTVAPGNVWPADSDELLFHGPLHFGPGSVFDCHAATHTNVDRLAVSGRVDGACVVRLTAAPQAVPFERVIVTADDTSTYGQFLPGGSYPERWELAGTPCGDLLVTDLLGDSDFDSLPDWYELRYFLDRTAAEPQGHGDADGIDNYGELVAGTVPTNAASVLAITELHHHAGSRETAVAWSSVSGRRYHLLAASDLSGGWSVIASNLPPTPEENTFIVPSETERTRFYRISVERE